MSFIVYIIGVIWFLSFWVDIINSFFTGESTYVVGIRRMKSTFEPFWKFFVLIYNRFFKKERKVVVG